MSSKALLGVGITAVVAAFLLRVCAALAQPACPPPPEATSARSWDLPAGCPAPFDVRAYTILGDLKMRLRVAEVERTAPKPQRALPPWAWALIAGAGAIAAPPVTCRVGEACSDTADGVASLTAAALAFGAAWVLEE